MNRAFRAGETLYDDLQQQINDALTDKLVLKSCIETAIVDLEDGKPALALVVLKNALHTLTVFKEGRVIMRGGK